jgi:hypothetical protein
MIATVKAASVAVGVISFASSLHTFFLVLFSQQTTTLQIEGCFSF